MKINLHTLLKILFDIFEETLFQHATLSSNWSLFHWHAKNLDFAPLDNKTLELDQLLSIRSKFYILGNY